jgi:hypothetical protein
MAEGFTLARDHKIDLKDPEVFAYVKSRWLDSAAKLFHIEYNAVKRYESTYGTLPVQLPVGNFMYSLGDSKELSYERALFGQDFVEMIDQKDCVDGDRQFNLADELVREGLIKEDELADARHLSVTFYNLAGLYNNSYAGNGVSAFFRDEQEEGGEGHLFASSEFSELEKLHVMKRHDIHGPKLSKDKERKVWKESLSLGKDHLYGNSEQVRFYKKKLNIYSTAELRNLREIRREDAELINSYESVVENRKEDLIRTV